MSGLNLELVWGGFALVYSLGLVWGSLWVGRVQGWSTEGWLGVRVGFGLVLGWLRVCIRLV